MSLLHEIFVSGELFLVWKSKNIIIDSIVPNYFMDFKGGNHIIYCPKQDIGKLYYLMNFR